MVLLGPSGCGKTTLLRCLAGLERLDAGRILIGGRDVTDLPPRKRRIAMVFQSYAVFPHMKVCENIAFGLRMQKEPQARRSRSASSAPPRCSQIEPLLDRYPAQLSGGQRQRVAVARAIVIERRRPADGRAALQPRRAAADELARRAEEAAAASSAATTIYVTHDQVEALSMGDRIAVMNAGHHRAGRLADRGLRPTRPTRSSAASSATRR